MFYTKEQSTPSELKAYLQAAMILNEKAKRKTEMHESDFPFWAIKAYEANERAFDKAEAEYNENQMKKGSDDSASVDNDGDSEVFGDIDKELGISKETPNESEV